VRICTWSILLGLRLTNVVDAVSTRGCATGYLRAALGVGFQR
jgi:hypothetical protein